MKTRFTEVNKDTKISYVGNNECYFRVSFRSAGQGSRGIKFSVLSNGVSIAEKETTMHPDGNSITIPYTAIPGEELKLSVMNLDDTTDVFITACSVGF